MYSPASLWVLKGPVLEAAPGGLVRPNVQPGASGARGATRGFSSVEVPV